MQRLADDFPDAAAYHRELADALQGLGVFLGDTGRLREEEKTQRLEEIKARYAATADPRYAAATVTASVVASAAASAEILLAPTAVTGSVSTGTPAGPLAMVRVRMLDSGEVTFTAADGSFTLSPVEPGSARVIELSAQGYVTATRTVTLPQGQTTTTSAITLLHS